MPDSPIACSLTASDLAVVKQRYRAAANQYQATARIHDGHADIALTGNKATLRDLLTDMIERENDCCPFLTFTVTERDAGYDVRLTIIDGSGLVDDILRESVDAFFPTTVWTFAA